MKKRFSGPQIVAKLRQTDVLIGQGKAVYNTPQKLAEKQKPWQFKVFGKIISIDKD